MLACVVVHRGDDLTQVEYRFGCLDSFKLVLDWSIESERPSKRHKFRPVRSWYRYYQNRNNMERPRVPDDVRQEVLEKFREKFHLEDDPAPEAA